MKRFAILSIAVMLFAVVAACEGMGGPRAPRGPVEMFITDTVTLPFTNKATEYDVEDEDVSLDIHYLDDHVLPYVEVEPFVNLIEGAIVSADIEITYDDYKVTLYLFIEYEEDEEYDDDEYELVLDYERNSVTFNRFGFFSAISEATETDFGKGLSTFDYISTDPTSVTVDLFDYDLFLVKDQDMFLMPFHLANLFLSGSMYDVYYNGDHLYGVDSYQVSWTNTSLLTELTNSSLQGSEIPQALLEDNYNFMRFVFDYFYGLRPAPGVIDYNDVLDDAETDLMQSGMPHYVAIREAVRALDDLHSSPVSTGYYVAFDQNYVPWDPFRLSADSRMRQFYQSMVYDIDRCYYGTSPAVTYNDAETIAMVHIGGFSADTPDEFHDRLEAVEAKGTVEKVIVDLACNTGGIIGTMFQTLGYMTDEPMPYHRMNTTDKSTASTWIESENEAFDFEWYILASPVTYSAGNMMVQMAKEIGFATIIGEKTTGGASSVKTIISPTGAIFVISSTSVFTNEKYETLEFGVNVDTGWTLSRAQINSPSAVIERVEQED